MQSSGAMSSGRLPSSLLRQHAIRFSQGAITLEDYRGKRAQILSNIITMHAPVESRANVTTLVGDNNFGSIRKSRSRRSEQPLTTSRIIILSVLSFTAALMSLLPNARTTIAAITSTLALTAPVTVSASIQEDAIASGNAFQELALKMSKKQKWTAKDIEKLLDSWSQLNQEQRYSARRYNGYNRLLTSATERAMEFRELAEVSTLSASLEESAREVDKITNALLNQ